MFHCSAGIKPSTVEVRFENLTIEAGVYVGDRALPTVTNSYRNMIEVRPHLKHLTWSSPRSSKYGICVLLVASHSTLLCRIQYGGERSILSH